MDQGRNVCEEFGVFISCQDGEVIEENAGYRPVVWMKSENKFGTFTGGTGGGS